MNKQELIKRFKSFLWRVAGMTSVTVLAWVASNLELFNLPAGWIAVIGLAINELTKHLEKIFNLEEKIGRAFGKLSGRN